MHKYSLKAAVDERAKKKKRKHVAKEQKAHTLLRWGGTTKCATKTPFKLGFYMALSRFEPVHVARSGNVPRL
jgi:hypothetical protein